jgi:MerR family transcriptional regulator, light-induced transcriptional regulator
MRAPSTPPDTQQTGERMHSIAEVERETGLPRATVRIWERRYGFPAPLRDERGERSYPMSQVEVLRDMRVLIDQGFRPAALIADGVGKIRELAAARKPVASKRSRHGARVLRLLREHDAPGVKREIESLAAALGWAEFVGPELAALNRDVGEAWSLGELQVHEEHLYTDILDESLRQAVAGFYGRQRPEAPRVLLTTFPQEAHGLGLRMAQVHFALQGCPTISLGLRTPIEQIAAAARAHNADLVGLSFTAAQNTAHAVRGLEELRGLLPPAVRIWVGGDCPALRKRTLAGVRAVGDVRDVPALLAEDFALAPL